MWNFIDMTGWIMSEHGVPDSRLRVIQRAEDRFTPNGSLQVRWLCECSCEQHTQVVVVGSRLRNGTTKSCGCIEKELSIAKIKEAQYISAKTTRKYNEYTLYDTYGIGKYSNCDDVFYFSIEDYDIIKDQCWYKSGGGYARAHIKNTNRQAGSVSMHELIGCKYYDHINRNRSDNRRENLRPATSKDNSKNLSLSKNNTSGVTGISWSKCKEKWRVYLTMDGKQLHLGYFNNKDDAIRARLKAEIKYFKEFAPQQHLFEKYGIV
jgi:hypothetical protein